jgi:hypothetical protein
MVGGGPASTLRDLIQDHVNSWSEQFTITFIQDRCGGGNKGLFCAMN